MKRVDYSSRHRDRSNAKQLIDILKGGDNWIEST